MTCITCGRPAHPVPVYVGGIGYVTMPICGLPDCWEVADKETEPRREVAALSRD